jgi:hypothetical protein
MNGVTVVDSASGFLAIDRNNRTLAGPFRSNAAAWAWVDRNTAHGRTDEDRYNRIRVAFADMKGR